MKKQVLGFLLVSLVACGWVFGKGLWGAALLAPVDIAPALLSHYRFVDPASNGIPANHHIVDQLSYELGPEWTIYQALHRGEIPWWDPYVCGGRPLFAADGHLSATDPIRLLCYLAIPRFELAYNWTRVLHYLAWGAGLFCLLRRLGVAPLLAGGLALAGEFAGCHAVFFGHTWVQAAYVYYPWLWLAWDFAAERFQVRRLAAAALLCAGIFCAGNLQSHTYVILFALAWCASWLGRDLRPALRAVGIAAASGIGGALLAAPALVPHLDYFLANERSAGVSSEVWHWYHGPFTLFAFFPWLLGTWRTLGYQNLSFLLFIGSAAFGLALMGLLGPAASPERARARRCAIGCVLCFLAVSFTPLQQVFYMRVGGLGALGLVVLAAFGAEALFASPLRFPRLGRALAGGTLALALGIPFLIFVLYPRLEAKAEAALVAHAQDDHYGGASVTLRRFQAHNLGREIGFTNPEVLCAWLSLAALAALLLRPGLRSHRAALPVLLGLNALAPILFTQRFIPKAPIVLWERLLAGGPEQQVIAGTLNPRQLRLDEKAPDEFEAVFPKNFAHFYGVHVLTGYSGLQLYSQIFNPSTDPRKHADYLATTPALDAPATLTPLDPGGTSRFVWEQSAQRPLEVTRESLNTLTIAFPAGPAERLLRTDTYYPGWKAFAEPAGTELPLQPEERMFTRLTVPEGATAVTFRYAPRHLGLMIAGPLLAAGLLAGLALAGRKPRAVSAV